MPISPVHIQKRMMQLGRVRLGDKKGTGNDPRRKLDKFRFTSASRALLEAVAAMHGGTVQEWADAPDDGYFEVYTEATSLDIILPPVFSDVDGSPTLPYSQWFERWSAGGCERRCDGVTESLSGQACLCDPERRRANEKTECKAVTRVSFMLPDIPGLGVWRLDTHGWNAAVELPLTLEVLSSAAREHRFIPAVLSVQKRTSKQDGQTRKFVVPVIELRDATMRQLAAGVIPGVLSINGPVPPPPRPALPSGGSALPVDASFQDQDQPGFGPAPTLPNLVSAGEPAAAPEGRPVTQADDGPASPAEDKTKPTKKQTDALDSLVGQLRTLGRDPTEWIYDEYGREKVLDQAEGRLRWRDVRKTLTRTEASSLFEQLVGFKTKLEEGSYFERRAAEVRGG